MTAKLKLLLTALLFGSFLLIISCFGPKKNVYDSPPARTIPLDLVKIEIDPFRFKPAPDSFLVNFVVPGDSSCPVKIEFKNSLHEIVRLIADSVYSAGSQRIFWGRLGPQGDSIRLYHSYYYDFTICDSTYTKSFYYRMEQF